MSEIVPLWPMLDKAVQCWNDQNFYDAHEHFEDLADALEDRDADYDVCRALIWISAGLHKEKNDVGKSAVRGKLTHALEFLKDAPEHWFGLELARLKTDVASFLEELERGETPNRYPMLHRVT